MINSGRLDLLKRRGTILESTTGIALYFLFFAVIIFHLPPSPLAHRNTYTVGGEVAVPPVSPT
jgi:hypothetical protein